MRNTPEYDYGNLEKALPKRATLGSKVLKGQAVNFRSHEGYPIFTSVNNIVESRRLGLVIKDLICREMPNLKPSLSVTKMAAMIESMELDANNSYVIKFNEVYNNLKNKS